MSEEIKETTKPTKPKRQDGDPPGYNPGKFKPVVSAQTIKKEANCGMTFLDLEPFNQFSALLGNATYPTYEQFTGGGGIARNAWQEATQQMMYALIHKQLVDACPREVEYVRNYYRNSLGYKISAPTGLIPIIRSYGTVYSDKGNFKIAGHVVWTSSTLLRGFGDPQEVFNGQQQNVDRDNSIGLDMGLPNPWDHLIEWACGVVNQWTTQNQVTIAVDGGEECVQEGVRIVRGFRLFRQAYALTAFPVWVGRALEIGENAERLKQANHALNNIPVVDIQALNALEVVLFNWTRTQRELRYTMYITGVENVLRPVLDMAVTLTEVTTISQRGELGLVVNRKNDEVPASPFPLTGNDADFGFMMGGKRSGFVMTEGPFRVVGDDIQLGKQNSWVKGMMKGKSKN